VNLINLWFERNSLLILFFFWQLFFIGTINSQGQCNNGNEMSLTEYNITNPSNYYKHDGTRGISVHKVLVLILQLIFIVALKQLYKMFYKLLGKVIWYQ